MGITHRIEFQSSRSSHPDVFLGKGVLKICSKYTGEHPCWSAISIKLLCNFIEITLWLSVLLQICCIFSEHLFLRIPLDGRFYWDVIEVTEGQLRQTLVWISCIARHLKCEFTIEFSVARYKITVAFLNYSYSASQES